MPVVSLIIWLLLLVIIFGGFLYSNSSIPMAVPVAVEPLASRTPLASLTPTSSEEPAATAAGPGIPGSQARPVAPTPGWQVQEPAIGIWISREELALLPTSGPAWDNLKAAADQDPGRPDISDRDDLTDIYVLAKALVYARTGEAHYREEVIAAIQEAMGTEEGGETLALGRNLVAYVIAADLVNLPAANPEVDEAFRTWLRQVLTEPMDDDRSLQETHELRPNNWGTHAGASRAAIALYLGDTAELERTAQVFKGWLGDRSAYDGFDYGRQDWQADPDNPVGINPPGATKEGHDIGGALPEEMRRSGRFRWPPRKTGYPWEGLQGTVVLAEILSRAGYPAWEWEDQALLRAVQFLHDIGWPAEGDDQWQVWLINHAYGADFPATTPTRPGKNMGWTDWTHS
ncbi:MAG: alginate lyase family protein [Chloroflexi bacterium]|nr:alginate lyase family protein [Chloroflexota bacterium]MCI0575248.1 alginate lyase family protein [Chloroflexota bacterium]MCI0644565.1 alginate lyase family protein [Chloroflexota bacterium]